MGYCTRSEYRINQYIACKSKVYRRFSSPNTNILTPIFVAPGWALRNRLHIFFEDGSKRMWWRKIFFDYICHNMNRFALFLRCAPFMKTKCLTSNL